MQKSIPILRFIQSHHCAFGKSLYPFGMKYCLLALCFLFIGTFHSEASETLPFSTVFKGTGKFEHYMREAKAKDWARLPIGERLVAVGHAMLGTPYKSYTLEIDNHIEAASANLDGMDCWTFFEQALAISRMIELPQKDWTPQTMLRYIELDRYRGGHCTGHYLSRLHYLEDWAYDNQKRGLVKDITRELGGVRVRHDAIEMTVHWRGYRYLRNNPSLLKPLRKMEEHVTSLLMYMIPQSHVRAIEPKLRNGDIICIISYDGHGKYSTAHVGMINRVDGVARFMDASSIYHNVVVGREMVKYLGVHPSFVGIMVVRPLK